MDFYQNIKIPQTDMFLLIIFSKGSCFIFSLLCQNLVNWLYLKYNFSNVPEWGIIALPINTT